MADSVVPISASRLNFLYDASVQFRVWYGHQVSYVRETHPNDSIISTIFYNAMVWALYLPSLFAHWLTPAPTPSQLPPASPAVIDMPPIGQIDVASAVEQEPSVDEETVIKRWNVELDGLLQNISGEGANAFMRKIESSPHKEHTAVLEIKEILKFLIKITHEKNQYFSLWQYRYNGELNTIPVPSDGNCLFHAFGALLALMRGTAVIDHVRLRHNVADWIQGEYHKAERDGIQEQDSFCDNPEILDHLRDSREAYYAVHRKRLDEDLDSLTAQEIMGENADLIAGKRRQIKGELAALQEPTRAEYVELFRQNEFHGGTAEIYALSQMFQVKIEIERLYVKYRVGGQIASAHRIKGYDRTYGKDFETTMTLVNMDGCHYDAALPK